MITIHITAAANAAIRTSLPKGAESSAARSGEGGGFCITLDLETIDWLTDLRRAGESYSDVILRLARKRIAVAPTSCRVLTPV
jgi:hypothetical protein